MAEFWMEGLPYSSCGRMLELAIPAEIMCRVPVEARRAEQSAECEDIPGEWGLACVNRVDCGGWGHGVFWAMGLGC